LLNQIKCLRFGEKRLTGHYWLSTNGQRDALKAERDLFLSAGTNLRREGDRLSSDIDRPTMSDYRTRLEDYRADRRHTLPW